MEEKIKAALTVEVLAEEYLNLCDRDCGGDEAAGIFPCQFWIPPGLDKDGQVIPGCCALVHYLAEVQEWDKA